MKILLIGGTGRISAAVTRILLSRGHAVTHFNRGRTSTHGHAPSAVRTIVGDRKDFAAFELAMQSGEPWDCVIDMICYQPQEAESLVRAFRGHTRHLVFTSTVDAYARPQPTYPIRENAPRAGVSAYGRAKAHCEDIVLAAGAHGEFGATVLRPVHTVSDTGHLHHSLGLGDSRLFDRYLRNLPIIVHGDGSSLWTVCHADDVASAYAAVVGNPRAFGRAYHLPGQETITWNDLHCRACAAIGAPTPQLVHIPTDMLQFLAPSRAAIAVENFQFNNCFDDTVTRAELHYAPRISFEDCVRRMHAHLVKGALLERAESDKVHAWLIATWQRHVDGVTKAINR